MICGTDACRGGGAGQKVTAYLPALNHEFIDNFRTPGRRA